MDVSKLKKRSSFPFETIAVAVSFSPRCEYIVAEAVRIAAVLNSSIIVLHIGNKTAEKEQQLDAIMVKTKTNSADLRMIWMDGEPVDTILKLCKLNVVDLLVLGAPEKENLLKFYIGSVARNISRRAKCSVLLLTNPTGRHSQQYKKMVVNGVENPKTIHTINTALYLAKKLNTKEIIVVNEMDVPIIAMDSTVPEAKELRKNIMEGVGEPLLCVIDKCDVGKIKITNKVIKGKQGYAISKFSRDKKADLLMINSPDTHLSLLDRIFAHDIEYILADLPCNVLIVHSRI